MTQILFFICVYHENLRPINWKMMKVQSNNFIPAAQVAIQDADLQTAVSFGTNAAFTKRQAAMYADGKAHGEAMRQQAAAIKRTCLNHLPELLEQAEANMQANGIKVLWAVDGAEANQHVLEIARRHHVHSVVKSKSMVTEETGLNHALEAADIDVLETDLGEYIVQLGEETPSHIVVPIVHKTKDSIRDLLIEKANMPPTDDTEEMTAFCPRLSCGKSSWLRIWVCLAVTLSLPKRDRFAWCRTKGMRGW